MSYTKVLFFILGSLSLCIGMAGIVIPGLPTTPFILLTAWLYLKSSDTIHQKLVSSRFPGNYIREYQRNKGMTIRIKIKAIVMVVMMIGLSVIFLIDQRPMKLLILTLGVTGIITILLIVPTASQYQQKIE